MSGTYEPWNLPADAVAEANRISERLRNAPDAVTVNDIADEEREAVKGLASNKATKPLAINISDLKTYMLKELRE